MDRLRIAVLLLLLLSSSRPVDAECAATRAADALRNSALGFAGRVTAIDSRTVSFTVDRVWKGNVRSTETLALFDWQGDVAAFRMEPGHDYIVFAIPFSDSSRDFRSSGQLARRFELGLCSPTRPIEGSEDFERQLGRSRRPHE